jgi:hypothetical protein
LCRSILHTSPFKHQIIGCAKTTNQKPRRMWLEFASGYFPSGVK